MAVIEHGTVEGDVTPAARIPAKIYAAVFFAVACGLIFRVIFPFDIEYKADEIWTFTEVQKVITGGPVPVLGMGTSFGPANPGLSLWVFIGLGWLSGAVNPPALARAVQILNDIAILALLTFTFVSVRVERREFWLWGVALWAVNPLAVAYERKIWPPSIFPIFVTALIAAWWYRRYFIAALLWGAIGALMAQVHIGAGFLALALAGWTFYANRNDTNWLGWLIGSVLGAIPATPWLLSVVTSVGHSARFAYPNPLFFLRWISQPFGLRINSLSGAEFWSFLTSPIVDGMPTFIMLTVHLALTALWLWICVRILQTIKRQGFSARKFFLGENEEWRLINASMWGYGGIMTFVMIIGVGSSRNYLIVAAPMMALWAVLVVHDFVAQSDVVMFRRIMVFACGCQILISACFLSFVHQQQRFQSEYGSTWQSQQISQSPLK